MSSTRSRTPIHRPTAPDRNPSEQSRNPHPDRHHTVHTDDGVPLAVRITGSDEAPLTVAFVHGHCLRAESWRHLRERLLDHWGDATRMVFYDHRGHGASGAADPSTYTIDQLGHDLDAVLRAVAPRGPVVLVGHSMGAMAILAYARLFPAAIGTRVVGVGLLAGAAGGLTRLGLGRLLNRYAVNSLQHAVRRAPRALRTSRKLTAETIEFIASKTLAGSRTARDPRVARMSALATTIRNETDLPTVTGFLASLTTFDETASLHRLGSVPALILAGSADLMVPFAHSAALAEQLAESRLVRLEGAGHSVIVECAEEVAHSIIGLVERAVDTAFGAGADMGDGAAAQRAVA